MEQVQKSKQPREPAAQAPEELSQRQRTPEEEDLLQATDDICDLIDECLEGLDQDLAENFRQVGGE